MRCIGSAVSAPPWQSAEREQGIPSRLEQPGRMHVGVEISFEIVMRRHLVDLAAFFVETQPPALAVGEIILDAHGDDRADAREGRGVTSFKR